MRRSYHFCHSNNYYSHQVLESDLHLLLKYYISVVPRAEQVVVMVFWCCVVIGDIVAVGDIVFVIDVVIVVVVDAAQALHLCCDQS